MSKPIFLSCSGSHKWTQCSKSPWLELSATKEEVKSDDPSQIGTMIHLEAERQLNQILSKTPPETSKNFISENMQDIIDEYINLIKELSDDFNSEILVEEKIMLNYIIPNSTGVADCVILKNNRSEIYVIDLKTGNKKISAKKNTQLFLYLLGIRQKLSLPKDVVFYAVICQPTIRYNSVEKLTNSDLDNFESFIKKCIKDVYNNPTARAGKHCNKYYCKARSFCRTYQEYVTNPLNNIDTINTYTLTVDDMVKIIEYGQEYIKWIDDAMKDIKQRALEGDLILPQYQVKMIPKRTLIKDKAKVMSYLESIGLSSDEYLNYNFASITQLEKMLGKDKKKLLNEIITLEPFKIEIKKVVDKTE